VELAAAAIGAGGLLTAWTCTQSTVSMRVELRSVADALAAGVSVARVLDGGDGMSSVTAEPVTAPYQFGIFRSVDCVTRTRDLPIPALACRNAAH